jgi:hypothetical protein
MHGHGPWVFRRRAAGELERIHVGMSGGSLKDCARMPIQFHLGKFLVIQGSAVVFPGGEIIRKGSGANRGGERAPGTRYNGERSRIHRGYSRVLST